MWRWPVRGVILGLVVPIVVIALLTPAAARGRKPSGRSLLVDAMLVPCGGGFPCDAETPLEPNAEGKVRRRIRGPQDEFKIVVEIPAVNALDIDASNAALVPIQAQLFHVGARNPYARCSLVLDEFDPVFGA